MRAIIVALSLALIPAVAVAQTIAPGDAKSHVGQSATIEGVVSDVHHAASGSTIFLDFGGPYPDNAFAAVIFAKDESKFADVNSLRGKTVDVTGSIQLYNGKPEIILSQPSQIKSK